MLNLDALHQIFRFAHITVGFAGLIVFWIPVFVRKGSRLHIAAGRIFIYCVYFVGLTGLLASIWGVAHPSSFLSETTRAASSTRDTAVAHEQVRFILSITGFLALATMAGTLQGVRAIRTRLSEERLRSPLLSGLSIGAGLWSCGLIVYGAMRLIEGYVGSDPSVFSEFNRYWVNTTLGIIGVFGTVTDLRTLYGPPPSAQACLTVHLQSMLGSGAGFYAAFFLFGASRMLSLSGLWMIVAPLLPLLVASIASKLWIASIERRANQTQYGLNEASDD